MELTKKEIALKTISRMRPEVARKALAAGQWYLGGFYVAPDYSCCCPFGAGVISNPRKATAGDYCDTDDEVLRAFRMAGLYDDEALLLGKFTSGLTECSQDEVRASLEEAVKQP